MVSPGGPQTNTDTSPNGIEDATQPKPPMGE